jgi:hypothetical protein
MKGLIQFVKIYGLEEKLIRAEVPNRYGSLRIVARTDDDGRNRIHSCIRFAVSTLVFL